MRFLTNNFDVSTESITADSRFGAFGVLMRLLNAALTFGFGYAFGAATFDTGMPQASAILGGFAYMLILDVAAFGWDNAARRAGISPHQRAIADGMSSVSMWSSTIISGVQLLLTTTLFTVSAQARENIGLIALILITTLLAAHFIRLFAYQRLSPEAVSTRINAEAYSDINNMLQRFERSRAKRIAEQVAVYLTEHEDQIVEAESQQQIKHLLIKMGHGKQVVRTQVQTKAEQPSDEPPTPPEDAVIVEEDILASEPLEQDLIDLNELRGNAQAAQQSNLNIAAT